MVGVLWVIWEGCLKLWQVLKDLGLFKGTKCFQSLIGGRESGWNMRFESLRSCRWFYDTPSISPHIMFCKTPEVSLSSTKLISNWYTVYYIYIRASIHIYIYIHSSIHHGFAKSPRSLRKIPLTRSDGSLSWEVLKNVSRHRMLWEAENQWSFG